MPEHLPPVGPVGPGPTDPTGRGHRGDPGDRGAEQALRRALAAQAAGVSPGPAPRVDELVGRARPRRWPAALAAAAAVAALATASAVALQPDPTPPPVAAPSPSAAPSAGPGEPSTSTAPSEPATPSAAPSAAPPPPSDAPSVTAAPSGGPACTPTEVPVLLWSSVEQQLTDGVVLRVAPDRARVPAGCPGDPSQPDVVVRAAVLALLRDPAPDPDQVNLWVAAGAPAAEEDVSVETSGAGTTVDLPSGAFAGGLGSEAAAAAVQSLVRTVVSNGGTAPVTVLVDGAAGAEVWGAVVLDAPLSPSTEDLAGGWVLDPYEGQRVPAGTVTLSGTATAFEGSVSWVVQDADGTAVAEGATQSGSNGDYGPWTVPVELPPGTWTVVLRAENMAGEAEGPGPWLWEDSTTFTVVP
ncbi:Gmad2 immunoglobulin-like domain-containing protein [Aquipuribacter hungaricus]|uniref:Gmad2 immunoglobulin-like domain-containing protein n=2 Tax=Aquipuribacter hungaricus TaxID=545624 RepID=A0ABV7WDG8_9MICO